jgi:hypothetical protein
MVGKELRFIFFKHFPALKVKCICWIQVKLFGSYATTGFFTKIIFSSFSAVHRVGRVLSVSPVIGIGTPPPL